MILRRAGCIFCLLLCGTLTLALNAEDNPKQEAKNLIEKAKGEGSDRAQQVRDFCAAAQLEPKNKQYADTCNSFRSGLLQDDTAWLASAIAAYRTHDLDRAESQARLVSSYDPKLSGQANFLLNRVKNEKLLNQVQAAWTRGDFQAVNTLAQAITETDIKATANQYVKQRQPLHGIHRSSPEDGELQSPASDPATDPGEEPEPQWTRRSRGKDSRSRKSPTGKERSGAPKPAVESSTDIAKKVSFALDDARDAEKRGDLQDALNHYGQVLKLQPGNQDAQSNIARIEQIIKNDPAAARNELMAAIRYFYHSQFDDAQRALMNYLEAPQTAKNPGVADFYLGATLIERSILRTPQTQWQGPSPDALSAFREARKANYSPVRAYVSPALLKIWDSTAQ